VTALVLGRAPDPLTILLTPGAEFTARLVSRRHGIEQPWPEGTRLTLAIQAGARQAEQRWDFTVTGAVADLLIPEDDLAELIPRLTTKARARLWLAPPGEAGGEFLWASGGVQIRG
jgi:hypothetical protein